MEPKDQLFSEFLIVWKDEYEKVKNILRYLETYPAFLGQIKDFKLIRVEDLDQSQREWLWLLSRLDNPIETGFMKTCWVPVNADEYDQFIDLSSPVFELFQTDYFCLEPYQWFRYPIIRDITQFMLAADGDLHYADMEKQTAEKVKSQIMAALFKNRFKLGLKGKFNIINELTRSEIIPDNAMKGPVIQRKGDTLLIKGITAEAISILPGDLNILLDEITYADGKDCNMAGNIISIQGFVFLLRQSKYRNIKSYYLIFNDCPFNNVWFSNETLLIDNSDKQLMADAYRNLQRILSANP